jgi:hypothetical protein
MSLFRYSVGVGLLLIPLSAAFCDAPAGLLGQWQKPQPPGASGSAVILEFRPDGTEHALTRTDGKLMPVRQKDGKDLVGKYTVKDDKLVISSLDGKHKQEHPFTLQGDVLTFLPSGKYTNAAVLNRVPTTPPAAPGK